MARFLAKRFALSIITLFILSVIVFAASQLLPGNVGRNVLGPFADQHSVDLLNHQVGADRPLLTQYGRWIWKFVHGDMGKSLQYQVSVWSLLGPSLENSLKLAAEAFLLVVPLSILGGVAAALRRGRFADRAITNSRAAGGMTVRTNVTYYTAAKGTPEEVAAQIRNIPFVTGWGDEWLRVGPIKTTVDGGILCL